MGLSSATALVVASMIGSGVFTTSGFLLQDMPSRLWVLGAWLGGGILATLGALSYGALARRIPESGGEYTYLARTVHPAAGYLAGWVSLLVGFSAPLAAAAFAFGEYGKHWLPWPPKWLGTVVILLFSVLHAFHVRRGAWLQNVAVAVKLILLAIFLGYGFTRLSFPADTGGKPVAISAFGLSLVWVSFSYSGWNAAVYVGGEVKAPERNLPRALLLGTLLVTVFYLALNTVFLWAAPISALAGQLEVGRIAAEALGGARLAEAVTAAILLALMTSVSAQVMAGPRVYAKMAADGWLPRWLAAEDGPPRRSIVFQAAVALVFLWSATYDKLLTYIGLTLSLSTAATVAALIVARSKEKPPQPVPGWPWVPCLFLAGVVGMAAMTVYRRPLESLVSLATLLLGLAVWAGQKAIGNSQ